MDKGYFLLGNAYFGELGTEIVIDIKAAVEMRGAQVAEDDLCPLVVRCFQPDVIDVPGTDSGLAVFIVGQQRIHEPLVQSQLPSVPGDAEHIVLLGADHLVSDLVRPLGEFLNHLPLQFRWLQLLHMVIGLGHRQLQHLCGLNIRHQPEHIDQLRQIVESCEPGLGTIAGTLRGQFHSSHRLTEVCCPSVKVLKAVILQCLGLQIPLHGVQLHHAVGNWGASSKYNTMPIGQLIKVLAFEIHIAGLLGFRLRNPRHVLHFTYCGKIFV